MQRHHRTPPIDTKPEEQRLQLAIPLLFGALAGMASGLTLALAIWVFLSPLAPPTSAWQPSLLVRTAGRLIGNVITASAPSWRDAESARAGSPLVPNNAASSQVRRNTLMSTSQDVSAGYVHRLLSTGWSTPENISKPSTGRSASPVVLVDRRGVTHVVWEENKRVYYRQQVKGQWSRPESLISGEQPTAAVGADGALYVLYVSTYDELTNVFSIRFANNRWAMPRMVSRTRGMSVFPSVAVDTHGVMHAIWADRTPGYFVVYHAWLEEDWLYEPIANARGTAPVLAIDPTSGVLHIAWQAPHISGQLHEIYHLQGTTYTWSTPENISASRNTDSMAVTMVSDQQGMTHLAWREKVASWSEIRYSGGRQGYWSVPQTVSAPEIDTQNPAMVVTHGNQLNLIWREGNTILYRRRSGNDGSWRPSRPLIANDGGLEDLAIAAADDGTFHIVWNAWTGATEPDIFHSTGEPALTSHVYMPTASVAR